MNTTRPSRRAAASGGFGLSTAVNPIAQAVALLALGAGSLPVAAQSSGQQVIVTGIRRAVETSIATKRNSDQIVEAASAEDIGKLPDTSIADSIARLPGLAAQRIDGRPSAISIRGLGPDYGASLLNGRQVVSTSDGRAAEYDQFPSELVNQVVVYKTNDAAVIGQGLSGTIDIRPIMPLDAGSRQVALNARVEHNGNGKLSSYGNGANGNRVSVAYVDQFADRTVGVALGFAHLDSPGQEKKYEAWRYGDYVGQWGAGATGVPSAGTGNNRAQFAQGFEASNTASTQKRDGFMAVLEYKPNKDFHSVVDLYYSKFDQDRVGHHWVGDIGLWSGPAAAFSNVGTTVVDGNTIISSGDVANGHSLVYDKTFHRSDKITSLGWNNELKFGDGWKAAADLGYSRADRDELYIQSVARPLANVGFSFSGLDTVDAARWSTTQNLTDASSVQLTNDPDWAEMRTPKYKDEIKSLKLSARRDMNWSVFSRFEAGLAYNQRDKTVTSDAFRLTLAGGTHVAIPTSALRGPVTVNVGGISQSVLSWDVPSVMGLYNAVPKDPWSAKDNKYAVHEKVTTAFAKLDVDTQLGSVPVRGNVGLQVVRSDQHSDGYAWNDGGGTSGAPAGGAVVPVSGGATYTDVLPSVNLVFNLQSDLILRFGLGKTMARPRMDDMRAGADQPKLSSTAPGSSIGTWSAGNMGLPELKPWRAKALDLTLEKYFDKRSYVAVAGFHKWLDSFIYETQTIRDFSGFPNYSTTLTPGCAPSNPGCNPNLGTVTTQANGESGKVWGLELQGSLDGGLISPALEGFGIIASESLTWNKLPKDKNGNTINLDGFSGIVNSIALYYERGGFSARISQRYRSAFTATTRSVLLNTETSTHIDSEKQVDAQVGYAFDQGMFKGLSLLLQVNNLTNAPAVQRRGPEVVGSAGSTTSMLPWKYDNFGRVVLLGASYKF